MGGTLQYVYSISVFIGVLVTSYLMMERDSTGPLRGSIPSPSPALRTEASGLDPALTQLLEMEDAISKLRRDRPDAPKKRIPSDVGTTSSVREPSAE